jgi:hypothetical protein
MALDFVWWKRTLKFNGRAGLRNNFKVVFKSLHKSTMLFGSQKMRGPALGFYFASRMSASPMF